MSLWERLVAAITGEATTIEETLTELEKKLMPGFSALCQKIASTIGTQGLTLLEQGLGDIAAAIATGGNIGAVIAALVPQVTSAVEAEAKQDAATAAHGAVELLIAALPSIADPAPDPTPASSPEAT